MDRRTPLLTVALALLIVLAGCSGGAPAGGAGDGGAPPESGAEATATQSGGGGSDAPAQDTSDAASETDALVADRAVIRTGQVRIEVGSYDHSRENLTAVARGMGGYVSDSTQRVNRRGNATWTTGAVVYRVPSERFDAFVERAKAEGVVLDSETNAQDVSDQLVDIEARLANLRAQRDRLRTLYDEADETEDVLAVGRELSDVQERIERLAAQQRSLENRVALSTVRVELREPEPEPPERTLATDHWYDVGVVAAFLDSVSGVVTVVRALVVGAAYVAPYVLVFGTPLVGLAWFLARRAQGGYGRTFWFARKTFSGS